MAEQQSRKQVLIDKANKRVIIATSLAAFVVIFSLVASQALFSQMLYQNRIVSAKKKTLTQLKTDQAAVSNLKTSYAAFVASPQNIIGGNSTGTTSQDGDNAKIILDALPSKYDFPALATSLEKLLQSQQVQIQSITGTDDEVAQGSADASGTPQPVAIPFELSATAKYASIQNLSRTFEASIRPIQLQTLTVSGTNDNLTMSIGAQTYYQPQKTFTIGKEVIK